MEYAQNSITEEIIRIIEHIRTESMKEVGKIKEQHEIEAPEEIETREELEIELSNVIDILDQLEYATTDLLSTIKRVKMEIRRK